MHQFGRLSERGANFFSFLQKEGGTPPPPPPPKYQKITKSPPPPPPPKKKEGFFSVDGVHKRLQLTIKFICNLQDLITIQTCLKLLK